MTASPSLAAPQETVPQSSAVRFNVAVDAKARSLTAFPAEARGTGEHAASTRVIVKLRSPLVQGPSQAISYSGEAENLPSVSAASSNAATLLARHAVRAATPLSARHAGAKRLSGRTGDALAAVTAQSSPARRRRAPAGATPPDLGNIYVFDLGNRSAAETAEAIRALRADASVLSVEEDRLVQALYVPDDPSYSTAGSWGQAYDDLYGLKKIGLTQAWDTTRGQGVVVAVIDTGIDYNHPDIRDNMWSNLGEIADNAIDDDHNGFVDDVRGWDFVGHNALQPVEDNDPADVHSHGTHVAGTIAATGDNNLGVVGVAWKAKVMAVRGLDDGGKGYDSQVARAIIYAVDNGADVINASWGREGFSQTITDAIAYAHSLGVVFVAAAGNNSAQASGFTPANAPDAIAVSALNPTDSLASFSNFGSKIELAAPGQDILSLEAGTGGYKRLDGTSMAAPHVSGVAALILAQHPDYSNEQVRQALRISATDLGAAGRDGSFGYGRVNAAQGVLVSQVLEARILAPSDDARISASTALTGTAQGPDFQHYVVDFGAGSSPVTWTTIRDSATSVQGGDVGTFDTSALPDGIYTVRLRAFDSAGTAFSDQVQLQVRYLEITWPTPAAVPLLTQEVKPGETYQISGSATGPSFQNFVLEWAPGTAPTTGWSTAGFARAGNGSFPVTNGSLGTWTPPTNLTGFYSLRLTVANVGFSSEMTTTVYAQPALVSRHWPKFVGPALVGQGVQSVRQPDGSMRFLLVGSSNANGTMCYSVDLDGSITTVPLDFGGDHRPSVGNLDGQPGDEVVLADGAALKIMTSSLTPIRTIATDPARVFWPDQTILADLDNDGVLEIIASARDTQSAAGTTYRESGALYVYRADGTLFSNNYPLPITSPLTPTGTYNGGDGVLVVAVDLDGDGRKEIVMAIVASDYSGYTLRAINADGTPYAAWQTASFVGQAISLAAADLDNDRTSELVLVEYSPTSQTLQVRVVNSTGVTREGWPAAPGEISGLAIGDLDRDGYNEIILTANRVISTWNDRGMRWSPAWPSSDQYTIPVVADIDGDGFPEIIVGTYQAFGERWIKILRSDGSLLQSWRLFGLNGRQPFHGTPLVSDFTGDGLTDIAVQIALVDGGGQDGFLTNSAITLLTTGTRFNASGSDWTGNRRDSQNSRTLELPVAPTISEQPSNQSVTAGQNAVFQIAVSGPVLSYQWRKDGGNLADGDRISGGTSAMLTITGAQAGDAGSYDVVVTNAAGSVTSDPAALSVSQLSQTITFGSLADRAFTATPITLSATASSGLAVSFTVISGPASVAGTSLTLTDAGSVTVRATQAGDATFAAATPVERSFTVTTNFSAWAVGKFTTGELADAAVSGPNADPDRDGFTNLIEYALGLEPKVVSTTGLPEMSTTASDWVYTYTRPTNRPDLVYTVEISTDLSAWTSLGVTHEFLTPAGDGKESWRAKYPLASANNVFFRLRATGQ